MFKRGGTPGRRRYQRYIWLFGFCGFSGFSYFLSHNYADLFYFSFFAFFGSWFTARLAEEMPDERYEENRLRARAATLLVPTLALFAIGLGLALELLTPELVVLIAALGWAAAVITYAAAFWYYEKH